MENLDTNKKPLEEEEEFVYTTLDKLKLFSFVFALLAFIFYTKFCIGPGRFGEKFNCNTIEIYYKGGVTEKELSRLCTDLNDSKDVTKQVSLQLSKKSETYILKFIIKEDLQAEEDIVSTLQLMAIDLSKDVFENEAVEVHICNAGFDTVTVLYSKK
jgi:hypothetical protein